MRRLDAPGLAWLALALGLAAGSIAAWWVPPWPLDWQAARAAGQPWRAWTAAFVHWSGNHLALNLSGCLLLGLLGWQLALPRQAAMAWLLAWPLAQLGLLGLPPALHHGGLSGVLHAGVAVAGGALVTARGPSRRLGFGLLAGLAAKLMLEAAGARVTLLDPGQAAVPWAHASGAAAGLLALLLLRAWPVRSNALRREFDAGGGQADQVDTGGVQRVL